MINEKDNIIKILNEKIIKQDIKIKNNENEIKNLNIKIEELIKKNDNELKEKQNKINIINKNIMKINNNLNEEINYAKKNIILKCFSNPKIRDRIYDELCKLEVLEKKYGFLSSIGIKLLLPKNDYEIECFMKAPKNSPYTNGIFNFIIKYDKDYPKTKPQIKLKTKIFHCNCNLSSGFFWIDFLYYWKKDSDLSQILSVLYQLFISNNPNDPVEFNIAKIYKDNYSKFERICQEYTDKYAIKEFNHEMDYLFQEYSDIKRNISDSYFTFVFINSHFERNIIKKIPKDIIIKQNIDLNNYLKTDFKDKALIIGNKSFRSLIDLKDFLNNQIIFVIPRIRCG